MFNKQQVIGHLAADATITPIGDDRSRVKCRIGATHRYTTKSGVQEHTEWFNVVFFTTRKAAESYYATKLVKGALVFLAGRTVTTEYTKEGGGKGWHTEVECLPHDVIVMPTRQIEDDEDEDEDDSESESEGAKSSVATGSRRDLLNFD
jgi:single-stranded DNA-binding protein